MLKLARSDALQDNRAAPTALVKQVEFVTSIWSCDQRVLQSCGAGVVKLGTVTVVCWVVIDWLVVDSTGTEGVKLDGKTLDKSVVENWVVDDGASVPGPLSILSHPQFVH